MVLGSLDTSQILWDLATAQPIGQRFEGHSTGAVGFWPKGDRIVSGSEDHTICVWGTQESLENHVKSQDSIVTQDLCDL